MRREVAVDVERVVSRCKRPRRVRMAVVMTSANV